jgi:uncharacterized protein
MQNNPDPNVAISPPAQRAAPIAPAWHTIALLVFIGLASATSAYSHNLSPLGFRRGPAFGYLSVILMQWVIVAFIWFGVRRRGLTLRGLIGRTWPRWTSILRDVGIAIVFLIVSGMILAACARLLHASGREVAERLLPHTRIDIVSYLLLCATAGFCEEVIFRGYLQKQFSAWTDSTIAGLLLQAVVFGAGHGYQGLRLMAVITVFGCLFGLLAQWRRSLRPGMIAHFLQDSSALLVRFH